MSNQNKLKWFRFLQPTLQALTADMAASRINGNDVVIYLLVRSGAKYSDGIAEISHGELAQQTGLGLATVKRALKRLVTQGYLASHTFSGRKAAYQATDLATLAPKGDQEQLKWPYVPAEETSIINGLKGYEEGKASLPERVTVINNITVNLQINHYNGVPVTEEQIESMKSMIESRTTPEGMRKKIKEVYSSLVT